MRFDGWVTCSASQLQEAFQLVDSVPSLIQQSLAASTADIKVHTHLHTHTRARAYTHARTPTHPHPTTYTPTPPPPPHRTGHTHTHHSTHIYTLAHTAHTTLRTRAGVCMWACFVCPKSTHVKTRHTHTHTHTHTHLCGSVSFPLLLLSSLFSFSSRRHRLLISRCRRCSARRTRRRAGVALKSSCCRFMCVPLFRTSCLLPPSLLWPLLRPLHAHTIKYIHT